MAAAALLIPVLPRVTAHPICECMGYGLPDEQRSLLPCSSLPDCRVSREHKVALEYSVLTCISSFGAEAAAATKEDAERCTKRPRK